MGTGPFAAAEAEAGAGAVPATEGNGVTAGNSAGPFPGLPADIGTLDQLVVSQNVTWEWRDAAPGVRPPETGGRRRTRFIYDFWLTTAKPNGSNNPGS